MITLENDMLVFRAPEVHEKALCPIGFQRTLRIPDDGNAYPLPPGLGAFPLRHLDDHAKRLPEAARRRGGVVLPMHQAEAMWITFNPVFQYPFAVKIATGKICALTGDAWVNHLNCGPQDYVVAPKQPWLDGYCVEKGVVRQFVAMPLGEGCTVEEQLAGAALHGGVQIAAYPMKRERYESLVRDVREWRRKPGVLLDVMPDDAFMGLAPGGRMRQNVHGDPFGLDAWDQRHLNRCFVTIANSVQWMALTGERPPKKPPTAETYTRLGFPWFESYGGDARALAGAKKLRTIPSLTQIAKRLGMAPVRGNQPVEVTQVIEIEPGNPGAKQIRQGPVAGSGVN